MKYNYMCVEQHLWHEDIGNYVSYGIALNEPDNILFNDVCCDENELQKLISVLNELQIETAQVRYLVEDYIYSK